MHLKRTSSFLLFLLCVGLLSAQGVKFYELSFPDAVKKAKQEKKYILVDAYTDWCHWCKVLDKETFPDPELGEFVNNTFVPIKVDMEDKKGVPMAWKYRVGSFPSTLVFNSEGQLVYKFGGYRPAPEYRTELQQALQPESQMKYPGAPLDFESGFPEFYKKAFRVKGEEREMPEMEVVSAWLNEQEDLFTEAAWSVLWRFSPPADYQDHYIENKDRYSHLFGTTETEGVSYQLCYNLVGEAVKDENEGKLEDAISLADRLFGTEDPSPQIGMRMYYFERIQDWTRYAEALEEFVEVDQYDRINAINAGCWNLYLKIPENTMWMKKASAWMGKVCEIEPSYAYLDTWAAVLWKSGDVDKAVEVGNRAIEVGEANGEDIDATQEMVDEMLMGNK